jgi:hypothetical protein
MKINSIQPFFCEQIPETLQEGKLYISEKYEIAIHLCACGCGQKTVTPLGKSEWNITNNNGRITLRPSIGTCPHEKLD